MQYIVGLYYALHCVLYCTPQPQGVTAFWLVLIVPTQEGMARLNRPGWLDTYRDECHAPGMELGHGRPSQY